MMLQTTTIGYIGLGLIGGSIARAMREIRPDARQIVFCRHEAAPNGLLLAKKEGVIDEIVFTLEPFAACDLIFLCAPVLDNDIYLTKLATIIPETTILTDVGSVKEEIVTKAEALGISHHFIGGHPMTGSEKTGYANSSLRLLENAYYILTPGKDTPASLVEEMTALVREMKALPVTLVPAEHDRIVASISHLPHLIASSLVNHVRDKEDERELYKNLAAGGFKDITRIASSSPEMWESICLSNKKSILSVLGDYIASLQDIYQEISLENGSAIYEMFATSREYRGQIPQRKASTLERMIDLYVDIPDETGAIAILASMLAANAINIKNIGIIHNREFAEGCLHVELYDEESREKAIAILENHRYTLYRR